MEAFKILKPVLWFSVNSVQPRAKLNSIFTNEAIATLIEEEFIAFASEIEEKFIYVLFGEEAVCYHDAGTLIGSIKNKEFNHTYEVHKLPETMSTLQAMQLSNGWYAYMEITKEDYEELISAQ
jgi:hypothetical protein